MSAEILRQEGEERNSCSAKMKGILSIAPNQSSMGRHLGGIKTTFQQLCHPQGDQKMSSQLTVISTKPSYQKPSHPIFSFFLRYKLQGRREKIGHIFEKQCHT